MKTTLIGYARCSTDKQDLSAQQQALLELGVAEDRIYADHGLTGTNRARPGLDQALAAVRDGDTLVVSKLDRLARSVPDARSIAEQLEKKGVKLALGPSVYDPSDPMGKMFFNILATFAEFESDLIRMRTREGMAIARAKGKLRGKQPKLSEKQQKELGRMHGTGEYSISDLAELFAVSRPTVYRTLKRAQIGQKMMAENANGGKMIGQYSVIVDWEATYQDPITVRNGEEIWLTGKTDEWDGHVWVWAKNQTGQEGWIPDILITRVAEKNYASAAFSALELTCRQGEKLRAIEKKHGWILCTGTNGSEGWVPAKNLQKS